MPGLNTASLPDLIFTVLFFFMIVTHMRKETPMVKYSEPHGTELSQLKKKSAVIHIYIGKSKNGKGDVRIQINDRYVTPAELIDVVTDEKNKMTPEDQQLLTVSIKADKHTKMYVVNEVKQALRQAKILKINYSAIEDNYQKTKK